MTVVLDRHAAACGEFTANRCLLPPGGYHSDEADDILVELCEARLL